jgi:hypothetical protein
MPWRGWRAHHPVDRLLEKPLALVVARLLAVTLRHGAISTGWRTGECHGEARGTMSLKKLSRQPLTMENFHGLVEEISATGADRAFAIVWAAVAGDTLRAMIYKKTRSLSLDDRAAIFEGYGPLASFSAKIIIGCSFDMYGPKIRKDLERVKDIKNAFAHARQKITSGQKEQPKSASV